MKGSAIALLGLFVIIAVIDSTQGHCSGFKKCKEFMNAPSEESKAMWKKCKEEVKGDAGDSDKKMLKLKMGACVLKEHKVLVDNKFNKSNFDSSIDAKFKDAEKAATVKSEVDTNCAKDGQEFTSDQELGKLMKCIMESFKKACGGD